MTPEEIKASRALADSKKWTKDGEEAAQDVAAGVESAHKTAMQTGKAVAKVGGVLAT